MSPLKRKIEERSINALRNVIASHPTMSPHFNEEDKKLSWDGFIRLYLSDENEADKPNFDDDVAVQIKGHVDDSLSYLGKEKVMFKADLDDLRNYYRKNGCLYLVIYMNADGSAAEIFYSSLYPSRIKAYLDKAQTKGNKKTISIPLLKLKKDSNELYNLCKQFSFEIRKQGSGLGQIVPRMIVEDNYARVKKITATVVGGPASGDIFRKISTGDVVLYGTIDDTGMQYPIKTSEMVAVVDQHIDGPVCVNGVQYYNSVDIKSNIVGPDVKKEVINSKSIIKLSENLSLVFRNSKFGVKFTLNTDLFQIKRDSEFLLALIEEREISMPGRKISIYNSNFDEEFVEQLKRFVFAGTALEDAGCRIMVPFKELSDTDKEQINYLCGIKAGQICFDTAFDIFPFVWTFKGKSWPIIIDKSEEKVKIFGFIFNPSLVLSLGHSDGSNVGAVSEESINAIPNYFNLSPEILANLYYYDYESMYEQVDKVRINDVTADALNILALNLISAFDISNNEQLLNLAHYILDRIANCFPDIAYYQINIAQIELRKYGVISPVLSDKLEQQHLAEKNMFEGANIELVNVFNYCFAVVKGNVVEANDLYSKLTDTEKEAVDGWPIRTLHKNMSVKQ